MSGQASSTPRFDTRPDRETSESAKTSNAATIENKVAGFLAETEFPIGNMPRQPTDIRPARENRAAGCDRSAAHKMSGNNAASFERREEFRRSEIPTEQKT